MSDYVAPEKREPLQGLLRKPKFVAAGPLHLAHARPLCGLKAPLGLSLLRKRQFLHSILFFSGEPWFLFAPMARCAAFGVIGTAQSAKEKQKRDMQLDHLRAPIFVFIRETPLSAACGGSSPEGRASCASTERYYFWFEEKRLSQMQRSSPFRGSWHRSAMPERVYFTISAS